MPIKSKRDKLMVVYSYKTILQAMRRNDRDSFSDRDESHKSNFEQNEPYTQKGVSCRIPLI